MATDIAALVRAGSGLVFIAVGALAIWTPKAALRPGQRTLGLACMLFGAAFVSINLAYFDLRWVDASNVAQSVFLLAFVTVLVAFLARGPWTTTAADRRFVAWGLVAACLVAAAFVVAVQSWVAGFKDFYPTFAKSAPRAFTYNLYATVVPFAFIALFGLVAARRARMASAQEAQGITCLTLGFTLFWAYGAGSYLAFPGYTTTQPGTPFLPVLAALVLVAVPIGWLVLVGPNHPRLACFVAFGTLLVALFGQAEPIWVDLEFSGGAGIIRAVAALVVALGLFGDGLGAATGDRPRVALRKQTLAAGALAVLFIVAQVAQNFFAAQYGLLMGGVVAGTMVFAASPIQRAMERASTREGGRMPARISAVVAGNEDSYRRALRMAFHDRVVTHDEEVHLADLGERLGIPAGRAMELRHEVEQATRARAASPKRSASR